MKPVLFSSIFALFLTTQLATATVPAGDAQPVAKASTAPLMMLADNDGEKSESSSSNDSNDDNGSADSNDDGDKSSASDDDMDGDEDASDDSNKSASKSKSTDSSVKSGSKKVRTPGGSGCDSAEDVAEHPECNVGN